MNYAFREAEGQIRMGGRRNTSLVAQGALAHRRTRPIHNNANSDAHPNLPPLGFNMAGEGGV